jgi:uncharacterized membrane protein
VRDEKLSPALCSIAGLLLFAWGLQHRGVVGIASAGLGGWLLYEASRRAILRGDRLRAQPLASEPTETEVVDEAILIECDPETLYALCRDLVNLRRLAPRLRRVEAIAPRYARWRLWSPQGRTLEWESTFTGDEPGRSISWRTTYDGRLSHLGTVRFERGADERTTLVAVQLEYLPPADAIGSAVVRAIGPSPRRLIRDALRRLKRIAEVDDIAANDEPAADPASDEPALEKGPCDEQPEERPRSR